MMNLPFAVPNGMEQRVHDYFGAWAIAEIQANGLLGIARNLDVGQHLARVAATEDRRQASEYDEDDELNEDEEENVDDEREVGKPKSKAKPSPKLAALPGLEVAAGFDGFITADGIAVIEARGTFMKFSSSFSSGTSTVRLRKAVRSAVADGRARAIMLVIDSPGGTVSGTAELADDIAAAAAKKPLWVYGEDLLASAAFWVASQSSRIAANRTAMVGSLGTVMVVYDMSKAFAEAGVEPVVFKSGDAEKSQKGAGTPGTAITDSNRAYFQSLIDETNTHFRTAVETGRPKADTKKGFAEAAVYMADKAKSIGLIDAVCSVEQFYNDLVKSLGTARPGARAESEITPAAQLDDAQPDATAPVVDNPKGSLMSQLSSTGAIPGAAGGAQPALAAIASAVAPVAQLIEARTGTFAASLTDIEAACPGAGNDFLIGQLKQGATVDQARTAFIADLQARLASQPAAAAPVLPVAAAPAVPVVATAAKAGVPLIPTKASASTTDVEATASDELDRLAKDMVGKRPNMSLSAAKQRVLANDEDLRNRLADEDAARRLAAKSNRLAALGVGR